jgi:hypothetical protein
VRFSTSLLSSTATLSSSFARAFRSSATISFDTELQDALTREQRLREAAESQLSQASTELEELTVQLFSPQTLHTRHSLLQSLQPSALLNIPPLQHGYPLLKLRVSNLGRFHLDVLGTLEGFWLTWVSFVTTDTIGLFDELTKALKRSTRAIAFSSLSNRVRFSTSLLSSTATPPGHPWNVGRLLADMGFICYD